MVVLVCSPGIQKVEVEGSEIQGHHHLLGEFGIHGLHLKKG